MGKYNTTRSGYDKYEQQLTEQMLYEIIDVEKNREDHRNRRTNYIGIRNQTQNPSRKI